MRPGSGRTPFPDRGMGTLPVRDRHGHATSFRLLDVMHPPKRRAVATVIVAP